MIKKRKRIASGSGGGGGGGGGGAVRPRLSLSLSLQLCPNCASKLLLLLFSQLFLTFIHSKFLPSNTILTQYCC